MLSCGYVGGPAKTDDKKFGEEGIEEQANSLSRNMLIPQKEYRNFATQGRWSAASITAFAKDLEVSLVIILWVSMITLKGLVRALIVF